MFFYCWGTTVITSSIGEKMKKGNGKLYIMFQGEKKSKNGKKYFDFKFKTVLNSYRCNCNYCNIVTFALLKFNFIKAAGVIYLIIPHWDFHLTSGYHLLSKQE